MNEGRQPNADGVDANRADEIRPDWSLPATGRSPVA
jgi:hypothetical protein